MTKRQLAAGTAFSLLVFVALPGTAFAAVDPIYGTDPQLDQACSDLQRPADSSGFTSFANDIQITDVQTNTETLGLISIVGVGSPVVTYSGFTGAHVNGHSVNIHAYGNRTTVYRGGALATYETRTTTTTTRASTCHVHKAGNGADNDPDHPEYQIAPPGLQTTETVSATSDEIAYGTTTVSVPGPWTDPNGGGVGEEVVICISPGKNPGNWRTQNGYDNSLGACSRAWYDQLGSTPSVSVPTN